MPNYKYWMFLAEFTVKDVDAEAERIVSSLLGEAGFTEHDIDSATSGLCATFALTLYRELTKRGIPAQMVFICKVDRKGNPGYVEGYAGKTERLYWRHACVMVGKSYFDIEGRQSVADMIEKYCWGWVRGMGEGGCAVPVSITDAVKIIRQRTPKHYDHRMRNAWRDMLGSQGKLDEA